jgi:hypothetical protein
MEQSEVVKLLKQKAKRLKQQPQLKENTSLSYRTNIVCDLANLCLENDFQRVLQWLQRNRSHIVGPLKRNYDYVLWCAKTILQTKQIKFPLRPPFKFFPDKKVENYFWFLKLREKNEPHVPHLMDSASAFQDLTKCVLLLANTLEDTADDLQKAPAADLAGKKSAEIEQTEQRFTDTEENILEALGSNTLHGPDLLKRAGYDNSSHYRSILSNLVKRKILDRNSQGYYRANKL